MVYSEALNGEWDKVQIIFNNFSQQQSKLQLTKLYLKASLGFATLGNMEMLKKCLEYLPKDQQIEENNLYVFMDLFFVLSAKNYNAVDMVLFI